MENQLQQRSHRARGGLNLSTAASHHGMPDCAAHSACKWAVVGFTKTLAVELGPEGIRVNAILPAAAPGPQPVAGTGPASPGRPASPVDLARTAVFAASDWAAGLTGQSLLVGGLG